MSQLKAFFDSIVPELLAIARLVGWEGDVSHHMGVSNRNSSDPIRLEGVGLSGTQVFDGKAVATLSLGREMLAGHAVQAVEGYKSTTPKQVLGFIVAAKVIDENPGAAWGNWSGRSFPRGVGKPSSDARKLLADAGVKVVCSKRGQLLFSFSHAEAEQAVKTLRSRWTAMRGASESGAEMTGEEQVSAIAERLAKGEQQRADAKAEAERRKELDLVQLPKALVKKSVAERMKTTMESIDLSFEDADDVGKFLALAITQYAATLAVSEDTANEKAA
jgi:hypothetical protein